MELVLGAWFNEVSFQSLEFREGDVALYKVWYCKDSVVEGPRILHARHGSIDVIFDYEDRSFGYYCVNIRAVGARFTLREEEGCLARRPSDTFCRVISCETLEAAAFLAKFKACVFRGQAALVG